MPIDEDDPVVLARARAEIATKLLSTRGPHTRPVTKEDLADMGRDLWTRSYKHTDDDHEAYNLLCRTFEWDPYLRAALLVPDQQLSMLWSARWFDQGLPQVVMGHKYFAALLATTIPKELLDEVVPPWKAFHIIVPDGLLAIEGQDKKPCPVVRLLVQYLKTSDGKPAWMYMGMTDTSLSIWAHGPSTQVMLQHDIPSVWDGVSFMVPEGEQDGRVRTLIGRAIANICLAMSGKNFSQKSKPSSGCSSKGSPREAPQIRTFQLGNPVTIDCRQIVRDYVAGKGASKKGGAPTVQTLVRGHWIRQACGPKHSERKLIHVEPYWRGPEGSPVLLRPHKVKGTEGG